MGCAASKLDNEDSVRRCKERRRLIKEAVYARHHLAAAHADYCRSLRVTGSALCSFASGEPLTVSEQTPPVLLHPPKPPPTTTNSIPAPPSRSPSLRTSPPQPPHPFSPSPSHTIGSSKLPHIFSASSVDATANRRRKPPKLPHILSESSFSSSPRNQKTNFHGNFEYPTAYQANSTYSSTPSQASSLWNWEDFYPPSPPNSEYFDRKAQDQNRSHQYRQPLNNDAADGEGSGTETKRSEYDFFQPQSKNYNYHHKSSNSNKNDSSKQYCTVDEETEREEVQCSEWGDHDHYSTTSSSDIDEDEQEEEEEEDKALESRSEIGTRSNFGSSMRAESANQQPVFRNPENSDEAGSSASFRTGEMKMVVRHKDLKEIVEAIKENFDKAAAAGDQVSEMLEIGRAQLDRSFRQLKSQSKFFIDYHRLGSVWLHSF
uniref:Uncharacterized protein MANES_05G054700 n=1 Tax=Rhizophora mucronata TaxID=61149 RepID=A0A2P2LQF9_RHIMU